MLSRPSTKQSTYRLITSSAVAFIFYFGWSYWANSLVSSDSTLVLRSALVQGLYSGLVTLLFTWSLECSLMRWRNTNVSLVFVVPILCAFHSKSKQNVAIKQVFNHALENSADLLKGSKLPGVIFAPLIPLLVQSLLVISVNVTNNTPNLWLTVAPSILFSALYGYFYSFALFKRWQSSSQV